MEHSALADPGLLAPLLSSLSAEWLSRSACVCHAWAAAEEADRPSLWRALVVNEWPFLESLSRPGIDWKRRYAVLRLKGVDEDTPSKDSVLKKYSFVFQGRWSSGGSIAFSHGGVARQVAVTGDQMALGTDAMMANIALMESIAVNDVLELELTLPGQGVPVPDSWQDGGPHGLEVDLLVHDNRDGKVAHFLSFTVPSDGLEYEPPATDADADSDSEPDFVPLAEFWTAELPPSFNVKVDTLENSTNAGCGDPSADDGARASVPWLREAMGSSSVSIEG
jgi:hypothetical protein